MVTYKYLKKLIGNKTCPISGKNENGEMVIAERKRDEEGEFFVLTTVQNNDLLRITTYYESGTVTETFDK